MSTQAKLEDLFPGHRYWRAIQASVDAILAPRNIQRRVVSQGTQFCNYDAWTGEKFAHVLCDWWSNHPDQIPARSDLTELLRKANGARCRDPHIRVARMPAMVTHRIALAIVGGGYHEAWHTVYSKRDRVLRQEVQPVLEIAEEVILGGGRFDAKMRGLLMTLHHLIEDIRIERRGNEEFPGAIQPMRDLQDFILDLESRARSKGAKVKNVTVSMNARSILLCCLRDLGLGYNTKRARETLDFYKETAPGAVGLLAPGGLLAPYVYEAKNLAADDLMGSLRVAMRIVVELWRATQSEDAPEEKPEMACPQCGAGPKNLIFRSVKNAEGVKIRGKAELECKVCGFKHQFDLPDHSLNLDQQQQQEEQDEPEEKPEVEDLDQDDVGAGSDGFGDDTREHVRDALNDPDQEQEAEPGAAGDADDDDDEDEEAEGMPSPGAPSGGESDEEDESSDESDETRGRNSEDGQQTEQDDESEAAGGASSDDQEAEDDEGDRSAGKAEDDDEDEEGDGEADATNTSGTAEEDGDETDLDGEGDGDDEEGDDEGLDFDDLDPLDHEGDDEDDDFSLEAGETEGSDDEDEGEEKSAAEDVLDDEENGESSESGESDGDGESRTADAGDPEGDPEDPDWEMDGEEFRNRGGAHDLGQDPDSAMYTSQQVMKGKDSDGAMTHQDALEEAVEDIRDRERRDLRPGEMLWNPLDTSRDEVRVVRTKHREFDMERANEMLSDVRGAVSYTRARLRTIMKAQEMTTVTHGVRRGRKMSPRTMVDTLVDLKSGRMPTRAYQQASPKVDTSFAVAVCLDQSYSIQNVGVEEVAKINLLLVESLEGIGGKTMAFGFRDGAINPKYGEYTHSAGEHHRVHGLRIDVFKMWDELFSNVKWRFAHNQAHGWTPMADGIQFGLASLNEPERTEAHRMLVVVTDGDPTEPHDLVIRRQLRLAKEAGVHVLGVGVGKEALYVKDLFPDHVWAPTIQEMPVPLIDKFNQLIDFTGRFRSRRMRLDGPQVQRRIS